jgi:hypothetical protein
MSYIFITEPYVSSYADIDVLLAIWRSGALHYYRSIELEEALCDFSKQITQLKRQRRELLELQEMRKLQDKVATIEQRLAGEDLALGTLRSATATLVCTSHDPDELLAQQR